MRTYILISFLFILACNSSSIDDKATSSETLTEKLTETLTEKLADDDSIFLNEAQAEELVKLPLACITNPLPYKAGLVIASEDDLSMPQVHHPAFYGCFDWHSAVHGHWSLIYLLKTFPDLSVQVEARKMLNENLTKENILKEIEYFNLNKYTKTFERTYGWAWLLKMQEELKTWDDPDAKVWYQNLQPLAQLLSDKYIEYLPKLSYPIRVGEHSNTAFGLTFAHDYAVEIGDVPLREMIEKRAREFYINDHDCPISWEPSGYDFLSPCLEEMDIMRRILNETEFESWVHDFLPSIKRNDFKMEPGKIKDRTDGKLVHLDGLNLSRAWCLYAASEQLNNGSLRTSANQHLAYSLSKITDGNYAGEHWLASFALYALKTKGLK